MLKKTILILLMQIFSLSINAAGVNLRFSPNIIRSTNHKLFKTANIVELWNSSQDIKAGRIARANPWLFEYKVEYKDIFMDLIKLKYIKAHKAVQNEEFIGFAGNTSIIRVGAIPQFAEYFAAKTKDADENIICFIEWILSKIEYNGTYSKPRPCKTLIDEINIWMKEKNLSVSKSLYKKMDDLYFNNKEKTVIDRLMTEKSPTGIAQ